jgi:hypothetical protein
MNKLKMLVLTALAAATVGVGALAAAPSASAAAKNCDALLIREAMYYDLATVALGKHDLDLFHYYATWGDIYAGAVDKCLGV